MGNRVNILGIAREPEYGLPERNPGVAHPSIEYKKAEIRFRSRRYDTLRFHVIRDTIFL